MGVNRRFIEWDKPHSNFDAVKSCFEGQNYQQQKNNYVNPQQQQQNNRNNNYQSPPQQVQYQIPDNWEDMAGSVFNNNDP